MQEWLLWEKEKVHWRRFLLPSLFLHDSNTINDFYYSYPDHTNSGSRMKPKGVKRVAREDKIRLRGTDIEKEKY